MAERSRKFKLTSPKAFILLAKLIKNKNHLKGGKEKHATGFHNPETTGYKGISFLIILPAKQDAASVFLPSACPCFPLLGLSYSTQSTLATRKTKPHIGKVRLRQECLFFLKSKIGIHVLYIVICSMKVFQTSVSRALIRSPPPWTHPISISTLSLSL